LTAPGATVGELGIGTEGEVEALVIEIYPFKETNTLKELVSPILFM